MIEAELYGRNTLRGWTHDLLKIPMYLILGTKLTSKIHRKYSRHHNRAKSESDYRQMFIDWESARFTKPDKPLNGIETLYRFYPHLVEDVFPIIPESYNR